MPPSLTFPRSQALVLAAAKISEAVVCCFVMPFVNQMVIGFGESPASAPKYAGLIDSSLIVTESIFAPFWGAASDRLGRKPLLILGLSGFALAAMGMGLAQNLWQAITARCISGILGAVGVLIRTVQFEITTSEHVGRVLETLTPSWAIGAAIGTMIGGGLAESAKTFPSIFKDTIFDRFPYLLPALVVAVAPASSAVGYWFFVPETLGNPSAETSEPAAPETPATETTSLLSTPQTPRRNAKSLNDSQLVAELQRELGQPEIFEPVSTWRRIMDPKLAYPLFCAALMSFVSMSYNAGFMMMASTPLEQGGLGLAPWQLGTMLGTSSCLGVIVATHVLPALEHRYGWYATLRITSFAHVCLFPLVILAGIIARAEGGVGIWSAPVLVLLLVSYEIGEVSFTPMDVAVCDRAPSGRLGEVNGIAMSCQSFGRMSAPALSGQLWSWCIASNFVLGHQIIWIIFTIVAIVWHLATHRLFSPLELEHRKSLRRTTNLESGRSTPRSTLILTPRGSYGTFSTIFKSVKSFKSLKSLGRSSSSSPELFPVRSVSPVSIEVDDCPPGKPISPTDSVACLSNLRRDAASSYTRPLFIRRPSDADRYLESSGRDLPGYHPSDPSRLFTSSELFKGQTTVPSAMVTERVLPTTTGTLPTTKRTVGSAPMPVRPTWVRQTSEVEQIRQAYRAAYAEETRHDVFMAFGGATYTKPKDETPAHDDIWNGIGETLPWRGRAPCETV